MYIFSIFFIYLFFRLIIYLDLDNLSFSTTSTNFNFSLLIHGNNFCKHFGFFTCRHGMISIKLTDNGCFCVGVNLLLRIFFYVISFGFAFVLCRSFGIFARSVLGDWCSLWFSFPNLSSVHTM